MALSGAGHWAGHQQGCRVVCSPCSPVTVRRCSRLQPNAAAVEQAEASAAGGGCPVLSSLQPIPPTHVPPLKAMWMSITSPRDAPYNMLAGGQPIVMGKFFGFPLIMVGGLQATRDMMALEAEGKVTVGWPPSVEMLDGAESILVMKDAERHMKLRRLLMPALGGAAVGRYLPQIQAATRQLLDQLVAETSEQAQTAKALPTLSKHMLQVMTTCALGVSLNDHEMEEYTERFEIWLRELFNIMPVDRWPFSFHEGMEARRWLTARMQAKISTIRAELAEAAAASGGLLPPAVGQAVLHRRSLLWLLLSEKDEEGNGLTDQQVVDNILSMMAAGRDTTSTLITNMLYDIAEHPQVLQRLREEHLRVVAKHGTDITQAALDDMPYTHAAMMECMRRRVLVGGGMRVAKEELAVAGHRVPQGALTLLQFGHLSTTDPRWPAEGDPASNPLHPANYNPDRFMTPEGAKQGQQFHFGMGQRSCAGIFMAQAIVKVFFALLLRDYDYVADTRGKWRLSAFVPVPADDLPILLVRRANTATSNYSYKG